MATSTLPIVVERYQADLENQDRATEQTVGLMARQVRQCAQDPTVHAAARNALVKYSQGRAGAYAACWASWWSIRHTLKFVSDDSLLRNVSTPNPPELELLVSPSVMVRARAPQGDCDDFTMLMCCFLECLGVSWEIVTVAADPGDAQRWSHVYAVAILEDGRRMPMDAAPPDAKYPGWEVPAAHILRYQAWDQEGQRVERERPIKRMQGYRSLGSARRHGLRGMGALGDCLAFDENGACSAYDPGIYGPATPAGGSYTQPTGALNPSTAPTFWEKEFGTLANAWTTIGSRVIAPTTTYTTPQGSLVTPGGLPAGATLFSGGAIGGISLTTIMLLVGGVVLVFALKK